MKTNNKPNEKVKYALQFTTKCLQEQNQQKGTKNKKQKTKLKGIILMNEKLPKPKPLGSIGKLKFVN